MKPIKIALLQMTGCEGQEPQNLIRGESFCRMAKANQADIAVFPEMLNIGYTGFDRTKPQALEDWKGRAISTDSPFVAHFQTLARELEMAIVITYLQAWPGLPRNAATLIDARGQIRGTYAKVHTCDFNYMESSLTPGENFPVFDLDTAQGPVKIGLMICYDLEFPESARSLMLQGAEIILNPVTCELEAKRHGQLQARARENATAVFSVNYPTPFRNGCSIGFDAEGNKLAVAPPEESLTVMDLDLEGLRRYRTETIWGNAYRRPQRYGLLTDPQVLPPFIRTNGWEKPFDRTQR